MFPDILSEISEVLDKEHERVEWKPFEIRLSSKAHAELCKEFEASIHESIHIDTLFGIPVVVDNAITVFDRSHVPTLWLIRFQKRR